MNKDCEQSGKADLAFFGKMTAMVSHEIKNNLASINENAGLMGDLLLMAEKRGDLSGDRLKDICTRIQAQVGRANEIVRRLNSFAHSASYPVVDVDLAEMLDLILALHTRAANQKNVTMEYERPEQDLVLSTKPFAVERVLAVCLEAALNSASGASVTIGARTADQGAVVSFSGLDPEKLAQNFPVEGQDRLLEVVNGEISVNRQEGRLDLQLAPFEQKHE